MFVQRAVDALGEVLEARLALSELALGSGRGRGSEEIAQLQLSVPAPESLEALFLLVELGERELLFGDLLVELRLVLLALAEELEPFGLASGGEDVLEPGGLVGVATAPVKEQDLSLSALGQPERPLQGGIEGGGRGKRPNALAEREGSSSPQLAPDGHSVPRGLSGQSYRQDRPRQRRFLRTRHAHDCSVCYPVGMAA